MSRAHDLAWCAGFFDGEGYVTVQRRNTLAKSGKRYESLYLRIGINHVAIKPLLEIQKVLGGTIRKQSAHTIIGNRKPRHAWQLSCQQAKDALVQLMPYFRNKNKVAELGIELQNTMKKDKLQSTEELILYRALLKDQIISLNKMD